MKQIWFIRHAESAANAGLKTTNSATIPLSEKGVKQAEKLAILIDKKPDLIIHSKFLRTIETAKPTIAKFPDTPVEVLPLHEFDFLASDKCIDLTAEQRKPMVKEYWERCDPDYNDGQGAESFSSFAKRIIESLRLLEARSEKYILVFTHGYVIKLIMQHLRFGNTKMATFRDLSAKFNVSNAQIFRSIYSESKWNFNYLQK